MRAWRNRHLVAFLSFVIAGIGVAAAPAAAAAPAGGRAAGTSVVPVTRAVAALPGDERRVCPQPTRPGQLECQAVYQLSGTQASAKAFVPDVSKVPGYGPAVFDPRLAFFGPAEYNRHHPDADRKSVV